MTIFNVRDAFLFILGGSLYFADTQIMKNKRKWILGKTQGVYCSFHAVKKENVNWKHSVTCGTHIKSVVIPFAQILPDTSMSHTHSRPSAWHNAILKKKKKTKQRNKKIHKMPRTFRV